MKSGISKTFGLNESVKTRQKDHNDSDETYLAKLLERTYTEAFESVRAEIDPSLKKANALLQRYVIKDLRVKNHSETSKELIQGLPTIKERDIRVGSELQSPQKDGEGMCEPIMTPFKQEILSPSVFQQSWNSNRTPKLANSNRTSLNLQSLHKPKLVYQSLSSLMSDKENSQITMNNTTVVSRLRFDNACTPAKTTSHQFNRNSSSKRNALELTSPPKAIY